MLASANRSGRFRTRISTKSPIQVEPVAGLDRPYTGMVTPRGHHPILGPVAGAAAISPVAGVLAGLGLGGPNPLVFSSRSTPTRFMPAEKRRERTDEELVSDYRAGDAAAFEQLVRRHHDDLLRFLIRLVGNRALAEDAFQETFLQVHLSAETFDTSRRFKPWLFTIAANKGRDALRRNARRRTLDLSAPVGGSGGRAGNDGDGSGAKTYVDLMEIDVPPPDAALDEREQSRLVQRAIDELPWSLREILLLAYFQRLSYNQIADSLGIPLGTVKSRLHAAVAAFAKKWQAQSKAGLGRTVEGGGGGGGNEAGGVVEREGFQTHPSTADPVEPSAPDTQQGPQDE